MIWRHAYQKNIQNSKNYNCRTQKMYNSNDDRITNSRKDDVNEIKMEHCRSPEKKKVLEKKDSTI